jgi:hypothetical protein
MPLAEAVATIGRACRPELWNRSVALAGGSEEAALVQLRKPRHLKA